MFSQITQLILLSLLYYLSLYLWLAIVLVYLIVHIKYKSFMQMLTKMIGEGETLGNRLFLWSFFIYDTLFRDEYSCCYVSVALYWEMPLSARQFLNFKVVPQLKELTDVVAYMLGTERKNWKNIQESMYDIRYEREINGRGEAYTSYVGHNYIGYSRYGRRHIREGDKWERHHEYWSMSKGRLHFMLDKREKGEMRLEMCAQDINKRIAVSLNKMQYDVFKVVFSHFIGRHINILPSMQRHIIDYLYSPWSRYATERLETLHLEGEEEKTALHELRQERNMLLDRLFSDTTLTQSYLLANYRFVEWPDGAGREKRDLLGEGNRNPSRRQLLCRLPTSILRQLAERDA